MSNVQLSGTLERIVARRTFPLCTRTGVCRNLFGSVDHDELRVELRGKLEEIAEQDQSRWNFNFKEDTPLAGNYAWEDVSVTTLPIFYRDSVQIGGERTVLEENETVDPETTKDNKDVKVSTFKELPSSVEILSSRNCGLNQENRSDNINSGSTGYTSLTVCRKNTSSPNSSKIGSTQVTDFFIKRKRAFFVKETEGSPSVPPEQTPRKRIR